MNCDFLLRKAFLRPAPEAVHLEASDEKHGMDEVCVVFMVVSTVTLACSTLWLTGPFPLPGKNKIGFVLYDEK